MSTFDPGFDPPESPGDWQAPYGPSGYAQANDAYRRAAVWLWVCCGVQLAMATCCGCMGLAMALVPKEQILQELPPDTPNREQVVQMIPMFPAIGLFMAAFAVFLMFPAIVMSVLGFKVRDGGRKPAVACMVMLAVQCVGLGLLLVLSVVGSLYQGMPPDLCGIVVFLGLIALMIQAFLSLRAATRPPDNDNYNDAPGPWPG